MEALLINGSPHVDGNTAAALKEIEKVFTENGITVHTLCVGNRPVSGCLGCSFCSAEGRCVQDDIVNEAAALFEKADCLIVGSPVHYASPCGTVISFLDRLFCSTRFDKRFKVGGAIAVARRGGTSASIDVLNKYFTICGMPLISGNYWSMIHGNKPGEVLQDEEGVQTMRTLAENAVFLMKSIALGRESFGVPAAPKKLKTNFIR